MGDTNIKILNIPIACLKFVVSNTVPSINRNTYVCYI